jgi:DNA-binding NtrC family response regulator
MHLTVRFAINVAQAGARTRTVLVLSQDENWRTLVCRALEEGGYRVLVARHSDQALVESTRHAGPIDVFLTDGAQGQRQSDFPKRILADHPEAKVLHLAAGLRTREELVAAITRTLQ